MGSLARFNLPEMELRFHFRHFVETGTGNGDGLAFAASFPFFATLQSCEIEDTLVSAADLRFAHDTRVNIYRGKSETFLGNGRKTALLPGADPALFWLDAHFPGADYGLAAYDKYAMVPTVPVMLPLQNELAVIASLKRPKDVILIDDLRIYVDGPFGSGNLPADLRPLCPRRRSIDFVHKIMGETHDVHTFFEHEGYIMLTPKISRKPARRDVEVTHNVSGA